MTRLLTDLFELIHHNSTEGIYRMMIGLHPLGMDSLVVTRGLTPIQLRSALTPHVQAMV